MTLNTKRRSFLTGLGALLAVPALVRATSLMPISATETYALGGALTWAQITEEAGRQLRLALAFRNDVSGFGPSVRGYGGGVRQQYVMLDFSPKNRDLPRQVMIERLLRPAMNALAHAIPPNHRLSQSALEMPPNAEVAVSERGGLGIRGIRQYMIRTDTLVARFDVTSLAA